MGLKSIIKKIIAVSKEREIIAVPHTVEEAEILSGKVAVILGGSGGIGIAIARSFVESRCKVIICGTNENKLKKCIEEFAEKDKIKHMVFNVADIDQVKEKVAEAISIFGKIDIVVNSAGVHTDNVDFFNMNPEEYDRVLNINLKGVYFVCQEFGKYMVNNKVKGHILLVSSSRGSEPAWSPYGVSKWGLNGITKGFAQMLLPYGIIVNGIAPGSTATELIGVKGGDDIYTTENRVNRLIMPDEVANIAKMLVSSTGDMIIGETIHISGGRGIIDIR